MSTAITNLGKFTRAVQEKFSEGTQALKEFVFETPPEVIVSLIAGFALQFFSTKLALPSYGVILGSTLSRLTLIIISKISFEKANVIMDAMHKFHDKFAIIPAILLIAATVLSWFVPPAGLAIGIVIGIYYGPIAERKRNEVQQTLSPEHFETQTIGI